MDFISTRVPVSSRPSTTARTPPTRSPIRTGAMRPTINWTTDPGPAPSASRIPISVRWATSHATTPVDSHGGEDEGDAGEHSQQHDDEALSAQRIADDRLHGADGIQRKVRIHVAEFAPQGRHQG